ncbi:DUF859 family phage minor structural protein [Aerococcaceae bacterium NML190073]|nr:DUF859 family phage minor structural protein [Aerococcaceae bacterium NML190073]
MASSGSITTNAYENSSLTLSWSLSSQDVANNTSTIAWTLKGSGSATSWYMSGNFKAVINGTTVYSSADRIQLRNGTVVASGTLKITHSADGTKSFSLSCEAGIYNYAVNCTASGTHTLTTIPRASSVSAEAADMGSTSSITITRASSSFTHTLSYSFGSASGTIVTKTTSTSYSWSVPLSLASQVPSALSGTCTITCDTYNGDTKIGTKTCTMKLSVPLSVKPTIGSLTAVRVDGDVPSSWGIYVKTKSKAKLTINNVAGSYGSTISSYSISGGGFSSTSSSFTTGFLNTSGSITFTAKVTDSRGRTSDEKTVIVSVVDYSAPTFTNVLCQRALSNGTVNDDGTYIRGLASFSYSSCGSKNSVTRKVEYKKSSVSSWTNANTSFSSGTAFTFGSGGISIENSYDVRLTVTDAFTSVSVVDTVSTAAVLMDFKAGGKGIAIGKVSEYDKTFEVSEDWNVRVYGKLLSEYITSLTNAIYPVGSIYMSVKNTNPSTYFGGTWVAWGSGRVPVGINTADSNFSTVEKTGGASTITLTTSQMPAHTHSFTGSSATTSSAGAHTHNLNLQKTTWSGSSSSRVVVDATSGYTELTNKATASAGAHTHTVTAKGTNANTGGGDSHSNLQPYIVCYMWKRTA